MYISGLSSSDRTWDQPIHKTKFLLVDLFFFFLFWFWSLRSSKRFSSLGGKWYSPSPKQSNSTSAHWELRLSTRVAAKESAHYSLMQGVVSVSQCWHLRLSSAVCSAFTRAVMTDWTKLISFFFSFSFFNQCPITLCLHSQVLPDSRQFEGATSVSTQSWDRTSSSGR